MCISLHVYLVYSTSLLDTNNVSGKPDRITPSLSWGDWRVVRTHAIGRKQMPLTRQKDAVLFQRSRSQKGS